MSDKQFTRLDSPSKTPYPKIATKAPLSLFYKRRTGDKVLYTMIQNGQLKTFEAEDYRQLHQDYDFELMIVLKGQLSCELESHDFRFKTGEGCLLNPQITHTEALADGCMVMFINLSPTLLTELLPASDSTGPIFSFLKHNVQLANNWQRSYLEFTKSLPYDNNQMFHIVLDALQQEVATQKVGAVYFQHGLVLRLLTALEDTNRFTTTTTALDLSKEAYLVNRVVHLIEGHFGDISRKTIEAELHYNAEYLNRLLKQQTGKTITAYAKSVRIKKAEQLLINTDLKVQEIADRLGFTSETYFYHYFKKQTQLAPNQYRLKFERLNPTERY